MKIKDILMKIIWILFVFKTINTEDFSISLNITYKIKIISNYISDQYASLAPLLPFESQTQPTFANPQRKA